MFDRNAHAEPVLPAVYLPTTAFIIGGLVIAHCSMRNQTLEAAIARPTRSIGMAPDPATALLEPRPIASNGNIMHTKTAAISPVTLFPSVWTNTVTNDSTLYARYAYEFRHRRGHGCQTVTKLQQA